ncbi:fibronectin-binding protein A N-terminus-domain-containing protein [Phycomyces nitens]|nr:fibronectin-binding protein A N-terminus-domain-containing protein [Phycomyces nitens]
MKQRFNTLDIRATVANLKERLTGLRLQNIYDVNPKTFLFKFAKPDDKELVLIESGIRIHTTQFSRDKSITPSPFCARLRKYLRTRRCTNVRQLGVDRIVDFEFGGGDNSMGYHIIAEFYASGNIILTDQDYRILALLRVVQSTESKMAVGEIYDPCCAKLGPKTL